MERDILQTLADDHAILRWLTHRLSATPRGRLRSMVFGEFSRALGAHQTVIDRILMPALKSRGWWGVSSDVLVGHAALKRLLADALTLQQDHTGFDAALRSLLAELQVQCQREREKLIPVLWRCFDDDQRSLMAQDAETHLTRLLGDSLESYDPDVWMERPELIEEAYLVLGRPTPAEDQPQTQH